MSLFFSKTAGASSVLALAGAFACCAPSEASVQVLPSEPAHEEPTVLADATDPSLDDDASASQDAGADAGPAFGLDRRPSNPTCLALANAMPMANPPKLSATGCVVAASPTNAAEGLIPFVVNTALWSDGATKRRWMALPDGARIHVQADGDFEFPVGAVLMKEFSLNEKRVETRLFMRTSEGWIGLNYKWNAAETDADLVAPDGETTTAPYAWTFPSRGACLGCHTQQAGFSLGPELAQLNGTMRYPNGRDANQLDTLDHIGMFDAPLGAPVARLPVLPSVNDETATVEDRARAYMHVNCSNCHRPPTGPLGGRPDFRFQTPLANAGLCNATPLLGSRGLAPDAKILFPGDPGKSLLSARQHSVEPGMRMPPAGRTTVDTVAVGVIDAWIASLSGCP